MSAFSASLYTLANDFSATEPPSRHVMDAIELQYFSVMRDAMRKLSFVNYPAHGISVNAGCNKPQLNRLCGDKVCAAPL